MKMKVIAAVLLAAALLPQPGAAGSGKGDVLSAQKKYTDGLRYYQSGDLKKAEAEWEAAVKLDPSNEDAKAGLKSLGRAGTQTKAEAAGTVAAGYRGTAIPVGGDQLLYVKKGDRVDVLVTFDAKMEKDAKETVTATILQNVVVLNVEKPASPEAPGVIELLLNPNEAQYAALSVAQGKKVQITVRAPGDLELHPMEMASFRRLIK